MQGSMSSGFLRTGHATYYIRCLLERSKPKAVEAAPTTPMILKSISSAVPVAAKPSTSPCSAAAPCTCPPPLPPPSSPFFPSSPPPPVGGCVGVGGGTVGVGSLVGSGLGAGDVVGAGSHGPSPVVLLTSLHTTEMLVAFPVTMLCAMARRRGNAATKRKRLTMNSIFFIKKPAQSRAGRKC